MNGRDLVDTADEIGIGITEFIITKTLATTDQNILRALKSILRRSQQSGSVREDLSSKTGNNSTHTQCGTRGEIALEERVAECLIRREIRDVKSMTHWPNA
jgi:hypothetical protein